MIDKAIDISVQIGWDTITDLELAHQFIEEKGLAHEFISFLRHTAAIDARMMLNIAPANSGDGDCC